jgi:hypothetical protein
MPDVRPVHEKYGLHFRLEQRERLNHASFHTVKAHGVEHH